MDTVRLLAEIHELRQQVQDWKDRYEQRMIAFEDLKDDRDWYKRRVDKRIAMLKTSSNVLAIRRCH